MSYKITNNSVNGIHDVVEFTVDTVNDLQSLPTSCGMGSYAIVIATTQVFMKNSEGQWVEL